MRVTKLFQPTNLNLTFNASASSTSATTLFKCRFHTTSYYNQEDVKDTHTPLEEDELGRVTTEKGQQEGASAQRTEPSSYKESGTSPEQRSRPTASPSSPTSTRPLTQPPKAKPSLSSLFGLREDDADDDDGGSLHSSSPFSATESPSLPKRKPFSLLPRKQRSSSDATSPSNSAAYDGLFDGPDAFTRATLAPRVSSSARRTVSRAIADNTRSSYASDEGSMPDRYAAPVKLDPSEKRKWQRLLADVASNFHGTNNGGTPSPFPFDGAFGAFARRNDLEILRQKRRRARLGVNARVRDGSGRLARLEEGIGSDLTEEEIEAGVDQAKEEMNLRLNEADLWAWAAKEVWALDERRHRKNATASSSEASLSGQSDESTAAKQETGHYQAAYGMGTPFYGPVLHQLLIHFRDRLRSPASALAVLQITRALGPRSLVLGCTSELYAEALRTRWGEWRDSRGCLELLKEAKGTGIVDARIPRGFHRPQAHARSLVGVASTIQSELRQSVLAGRAQNDGLPGTMGHDRPGNDRDNDDKLAHLFPTDVQTAPSSTGSASSPMTSFRPKAIGDEALSLAAIQALHVADDIGRIIRSDSQESSPSWKQEEPQGTWRWSPHRQQFAGHGQHQHERPGWQAAHHRGRAERDGFRPTAHFVPGARGARRDLDALD